MAASGLMKSCTLGILFEWDYIFILNSPGRVRLVLSWKFEFSSCSNKKRQFCRDKGLAQYYRKDQILRRERQFEIFDSIFFSWIQLGSNPMSSLSEFHSIQWVFREKLLFDSWSKAFQSKRNYLKVQRNFHLSMYLILAGTRVQSLDRFATANSPS